MDILDKFEKIYKQMITESDDEDEFYEAAAAEEESIEETGQAVVSIEGTKDMPEKTKEELERLYGVTVDYEEDISPDIVIWTISGPIDKVRDAVIGRWNHGDKQEVTEELAEQVREDAANQASWKKVLEGMDCQEELFTEE